MQKLGNYDNVLNDSKSQTKLENLNEMSICLICLMLFPKK